VNVKLLASFRVVPSSLGNGSLSMSRCSTRWPTFRWTTLGIASSSARYTHAAGYEGVLDPFWTTILAHFGPQVCVFIRRNPPRNLRCWVNGVSRAGQPSARPPKASRALPLGALLLFPLPSAYGTCKTVKAGLWPCLRGKSPRNVQRCSLFDWKRITLYVTVFHALANLPLDHPKHRELFRSVNFLFLSLPR